MGSFLAGVKAGTVGGLFYIGVLILFNLVVMTVYKDGVISLIEQTYPTTCLPVAPVNGTSAEDCYSSVLTLFLPFIAFLGFFVVIIACGVLGAAYDSLPGWGTISKGLFMALGTGGALAAFSILAYNVLLVYSGSPVDTEFAILFPILTAVFGVIIGKLYVRYTRLVSFQKMGEGDLRILLDDNDVTGKSKTLAFNSVHRLRADTAEGSSFKEWAPSGGVKLEDARSFDTVLEVEGNGTLSAHIGKKY